MALTALTDSLIFAEELAFGFTVCFYAFMRTTIDLSDELLRAAKARAASEGESLKSFITHAVEHALGRTDAPREARRVRLPLFGDPSAPKATLTNEDIRDVLAAEDVEYVRRTRGGPDTGGPDEAS